MNIRQITLALAVSLAAGTVAMAAEKAGEAKPKTDDVAALFARFDTNKDNKLTVEEFGLGKTYFTALDIDRDGILTREEAKAALSMKDEHTEVNLRKIDTNGDGVVTLREWTGTQAEFNALDTDRDGLLTKKDRDQARAETRAEKRFTALDKNHDGIISRDEWPGDDSSYRLQDKNRNGSVTQDELVEEPHHRHAS